MERAPCGAAMEVQQGLPHARLLQPFVLGTVRLVHWAPAMHAM